MKKMILAALAACMCVCLCFGIFAACDDRSGNGEQPAEYTITANNGTGYTVDAPASAKEGDTVPVTVTVTNEDTYVTGVTYNGHECDEADGKYTFTMPAENVTAYAKWQMSNLGGELTGIRTAEELMAMSGNLAGNYYLENDISMSGYEWIPVGTKNEPFTGSFDGKNFTIKSLRITNCNLSYAGFFGYSDGEIKNIYIIYVISPS